jgi:hypothetical protein
MKKQHRLIATKDDPEIKIRIPAELYHEIVDEAAMNGRSYNHEIVARLASTFSNEEIMATDKLLRAIFGSTGVRPVAKK